MIEQIQPFIVWILFWVLGWVGFYILPKNKQSYTKNFISVSAYFIVISIFIAYYYKYILINIYNALTIFQIILIIFFLSIIFLTYFVSNKLLIKPVEFIEKYSTAPFLELDYRYIVSKSFEIFYQQLLIIALVYSLDEVGLNLTMITLVFAVMFGLSHIGSLKYHKNIFGIIILFSAILSSFFFPYLILKFKYGFIYTYIAHWLFYSNTGLLFWLMNQPWIKKRLK